MQDNIEKIRQACIKANPDIEKGYTVNEIHGRSGQTTDKRELYAAKVSIGRPIRLADMLLAVKSKITNGGIKYSERTKMRNDLVDIWNLLKDDLREQSEETVAFLASLLLPTNTPHKGE